MARMLAMPTLPNGRSQRAQLEQELGAAKELRQLTNAYVARVRTIYKSLSARQKRDITPLMQGLKEIARRGPGLRRRSGETATPTLRRGQRRFR